MPTTSQPSVPPSTKELAHLTPTVIDSMWGHLDSRAQHRLLDALNVHVPSRNARGGIGRLLRAQFRKVHPQRLFSGLKTLTVPLYARSVELLGDQFANPSVDDLSECCSTLIDEFGVVPTRLWLLMAVASGASAADVITTVLDTPLLTPADTPLPAVTPTTTTASNMRIRPVARRSDRRRAAPRPDADKTTDTAKAAPRQDKPTGADEPTSADEPTTESGAGRDENTGPQSAPADSAVLGSEIDNPDDRPVHEPTDGSDTSFVVDQSDGFPDDLGEANVVEGDERLGEDAGLVETDAALFTALDKLLISNVVASVHGQHGAPSVQEMAQAVEEFVELNVARANSLFHRGFLFGLTGIETPLSQAGQNEARRQAELFGRLIGYLRREAHSDALGEALTIPDRTAALLADPNQGEHLISPLVLAALSHSPDKVPWLVETRNLPFAGVVDTFQAVHEHGRRLLIDDRPEEAREVFGALCRWAPLTTHPEAFAADLSRRLSACHRATGDFLLADEVLDGLGDPSNLPENVSALIAAERGLIAAGVDHFTNLRFPTDDDQAFTLTSSLKRGRDHFEQALAIDPRQMHAAFCLGLLAWCDRQLANAATFLDMAATVMSRDPLLASTRLAADARLHQALALLTDGQIGHDVQVRDAITDALNAGLRPSSAQLVEALTALATLESAEFPTVVLGVAAHVPDAVVPVVGELAAIAARGSNEAIKAAVVVAGVGSVNYRGRLDLLVAAADGALLTGDTATFDDIVEAVDELLGKALERNLDLAWADVLGEHEAIRTALGSAEADMARIEMYRRCGELVSASSLVEALFYRAQAGQLAAYDPCDLLDRLSELGADAQHVATLRSLVTDVFSPDADRTNLVEVVFVGGDSRQAPYVAAIEKAIRRRVGDRVTVHWIHSGWETNWAKYADRAEALFPRAGAVVLMSFMRTNLGRRLRRTAGEAGLQWRTCTGHGRKSLEDAIFAAIAIADAAVPVDS